MLQTALHYSHQLLKEIVQLGDTVIDGTVGNGHDTLFLAKLVGPTGLVLGFDVQKQAIETTQARLLENDSATQVKLIHAGHETLTTLLTETQTIKGAIFNLGYLPKSNKKIITQSDTTLQALQAILPRLVPGGRIIIVIYYGHEGGSAEKEAVLDFAQNLPQSNYNVLTYQFINQQNTPPILLAIEQKN